MYLLPAIDILDGKAVRLAKGDYDRVTIYNDDPVEQARAFETAGAEWVHIVDLDGARTGAAANLPIIEEIMRKTLLKVEVGGGIRTIEMVEALQKAGVARIVLGTALVKDPAFADEAIGRFGKLLAAGIDARDGEVAVSGWEKGTGVRAEDLVRRVAEKGFRHLVYTDIARDGMQTGIDAEVYARMATVFGHGVTASGGIAGMDDIEALGAYADVIEGVIAGRAVYEGALDVACAVQACNRLTHEALVGKIADRPCSMCAVELPGDED